MDHLFPLPGKGTRHAHFDIAQTALLFSQRKASSGAGDQTHAEVVDRLDIGFTDCMGQKYRAPSMRLYKLEPQFEM